jgi:hypothetical protein
MTTTNITHEQINEQLNSAVSAFNQNPTPAMAGVIKRLRAARKNAFSTARLNFLPSDVLRSPMAHHKLGLSYTATGYGSKIPTEYMVNLGNKWRRVYCCIYSNIGTVYICCADGKYVVDFEGV